MSADFTALNFKGRREVFRMALPEACGVWIEQRVQEELDARGDTGTSLREIGRMVAAEVEKHFETKVKPGTITVKALRMDKGVTNVTPKESPEKSDSKGGDIGDKIKPAQAVYRVKAEIRGGLSQRKAVEKVAADTGLGFDAVRKAYQRKKAAEWASKTPSPSTTSTPGKVSPSTSEREIPAPPPDSAKGKELAAGKKKKKQAKIADMSEFRRTGRTTSAFDDAFNRLNATIAYEKEHGWPNIDRHVAENYVAVLNSTLKSE